MEFQENELNLNDKNETIKEQYKQDEKITIKKVKIPIDRAKYKGRYDEYNKNYHKKRYEERKEEYKANEKLRRKRIKEALNLLKEQGIKLIDIKI